MKISTTLLCAALLSLAGAAHAQNYPAKTVRILVGFAPGGSTDLTARIFAQELNKLWNSQVVVDNRPGASGMIGAELAAKSPPDGYTWLVSPQTSTVVTPLIFKKVNYEPIRDFAPIAVIGSTPQLLVLHPSLPPRNFREFSAFVKRNAKTLSYASGGFGSTPHMAGELFNTSLGVRVTHVPYKGENPGVADLLGGQIPYMFSNFPVVFPHVKEGKLRAVAITSLKRSALAPEFPTVAEMGIAGFDTATWSGLYLPAATPRELIRRVHADITRIQSAPEFKKRMLDIGIDHSEVDSPEKLAAYLKSETAKWGKVIREAGVKAE
ncbi:MAG TPA: tripartite tricarboxylate transporter substrate binding protein [Burkholderiales bacterium]|nr:tripartite tricarboxylate transporter substrate binding protein [Burkholderiales bacterium]